MIKKREWGHNQKKYLIILLTTVISILIVINYISSIKNETDTIVGKSMSEQMNRSNEVVSQYLESKVQLLRNIGEDYNIINQSGKNNFQNYISVLIDSNEFEFVSVIDKEGNLTLKDGTSIDVRNKQYYLEGLKGKVVISNLVDGIKVTEDSISVCVPIYQNNEIVSFIYAAISSKNLQKELTTIINDEKGFACIIDGKGNVILRSENTFKDDDFINFYHYMVYKDVGLDAYVERVRDGVAENKNEVIKISEANENGYLGYSAVSENSDWRIVSYITEDRFLQYINKVSEESFKMLIYIVSLILAVSIYIVRSELRMKRELQRASSIDNLTKIGNGLSFNIESKKILARNNNSNYVIVVFDINKFKYVNHSYGYNFGDYILKVIASAISERFNDKETCSRINGDIFMILARNRQNFIEELKSYLVETVENCDNKGRDLSLVFNFGLYEIQDRNEPLSEMIDKTNLAWKHVKNNNKLEYYYYDENLMKFLLEEDVIENTMKKALKNEEFKVYLQPMINLEENRISGVESLVRWSSKDLGFMPPDRFISLFEKNGFIVDLDFYVLEKSCEILKYYISKGLTDFVFSVNQSRETISDPDYINRLKVLIDKYNIPPKLIELEVTENIFVNNYQKILITLQKVSELGFSISMDDFGSGYSSLNLLKQMPINTLKIDRAFLNDGPNSSRAKLIIKSVIELAKNLNINVVCEGVETKEQEAFLKKEHCERAQGFYYGTPVPVEEFNKLVL